MQLLAGGTTGMPTAAKLGQPQAQPGKASHAMEKPRSKQAAVALMFKATKLEHTQAKPAHAEPVEAAASCHAGQSQPQAAAVVADGTLQQSVDASARQHSTRCEPVVEQDRLHVASGQESKVEMGGAHEAAQRASAAADAAAEDISGDAVQREPEGQASPDDSGIGELEGVDVAEQRQILHDLWLQRNASLTRTAVKRPGVGGGKVDNKRTRPNTVQMGKQAQLSGLLRKPHVP